MNIYDNEPDRELFESSFVRYTYDKGDLSQEEVDQYIVLCTEVVISSSIQGTINVLQHQIDIAIQEDGKIPMALVEASNTARKEYNDCVNRQQKLNNDLKVKRSDKPMPSPFKRVLGVSSIAGFQSMAIFIGASGNLKSKPKIPSAAKSSLFSSAGL
jgi:hypothetical protein